jgi:hypothetical protein
MSFRYYRAVALDLDGTIACDGPPGEEVLAAIRAARADGIRVLLVTGRILTELEGEFPGLADEFDAVVAENGAVLALCGVVRPLARQVDPELLRWLTGHGVAVRQGAVILALRASAAHLALDAVQDLRLDAQLVRNRGELMVLPAGVTKGGGLVDALGELGVSPHSAIAVGDAENDHALFEAAELGVAVSNAVDSLVAHADLVLPAPNGAGVAALLGGMVLGGTELAVSGRWKIRLGTDEEGRPVTVPAAQKSVLITGPPGAGKSYLAGLVAEQVIGLGYSVVVFDPEGDHTELGMLNGTTVFGADGHLPPPWELIQFVRPDTSVVLDLSLLDDRQRNDYAREVSRLLQHHRDRTGLPHWIVLDEAHWPLGRLHHHAFRPDGLGYCLATYQPHELTPALTRGVPWHVTVRGGGEAVLGAAGGMTTFRIAERRTNHVRHQHKYTSTDLPRHRGFHFRHDDGPTGVVATNLNQFVTVLRECDAGVLRHHSMGRDMSRWIRDVHRDQPLAGHLRRLESRIAAGADVDEIRPLLVKAIEQRYGMNENARMSAET